MYIQLTTRCNFHCLHCGMAATKHGEDMSWDTFKCAIQQAEDYEDAVALGGGEPTLHPEFEKFLMYAIAHKSRCVWLATNGSQKDRALAVAALAKSGIIGAALSIDEWHDPIDPKVVEAFTKKSATKWTSPNEDMRKACDQREIRTVTRITRVGRAATKTFTRSWETEIGCICDGDSFVDPAGNVHQCGCKTSPIVGNVRDGFISLVEQLGLEERTQDTNLEIWSCYKKIEKWQRSEKKAEKLVKTC